MVRELRNKPFAHVLGSYRHLILTNGFALERAPVLLDDRVFLRVTGVLLGVRITENSYVSSCSWLSIWKQKPADAAE